MQADFDVLLRTAARIGLDYPEGVVFIGGLAVYLHTVNVISGGVAETTHDGDFYISMADMADLRDIEEVTPNRRLSKHQLIKNGFEFDIYTEQYSALAVPYDEVSAHAVGYDGIKVACLEHLLALKLHAAQDRAHSGKGDKDAKDIYRIAMCLSERATTGTPMEPGLVTPYIDDKHIAHLDRITQNNLFALSISGGNAHRAKSVKRMADQMRECLVGHYHQEWGPS